MQIGRFLGARCRYGIRRLIAAVRACPEREETEREGGRETDFYCNRQESSGDAKWRRTLSTKKWKRGISMISPEIRIVRSLFSLSLSPYFSDRNTPTNENCIVHGKTLPSQLDTHALYGAFSFQSDNLQSLGHRVNWDLAAARFSTLSSV